MKWEYKHFIEFDRIEEEKALKVMGEDGWELVSVVILPNFHAHQKQYFFKRPAVEVEVLMTNEQRLSVAQWFCTFAGIVWLFDSYLLHDRECALYACLNFAVSLLCDRARVYAAKRNRRRR